MTLPPAMPYAEWLAAVFTPQEGEAGLSWDVTPWAGPPAQEVEYLIRLFENCGRDLRPFSDDQVRNGLEYLLSIGGEVGSLLDDEADWNLRRRGIRSIETLYRDCFAARCSSNLSHGWHDELASPINGPCYMLWDVFPTWGRPNDPLAAETDAELLGLMARLLDLRHPACQHDACCESVLHGLGHWQMHYPNEVRQIIETFLRQNPHRRPELLSYARSAANGCVE